MQQLCTLPVGALSLSMAKLANMKCRPTAKEKKGAKLQMLNKDKMRLFKEAGGRTEDSWQGRPNDMGQLHSH